MVYVYKQYYTALRSKEILTHAIAWRKLEDIMLSKMSQSQEGQILYDSIHMRYLE